MPTLGDITQLLDASLTSVPGGASVDALQSRDVRGIGALATATADELTFLTHERYLGKLSETQALCCIVPEKLKIESTPCALLPLKDVDLAVAKVLTLYAPPVPRPADVHPTAVVDPSAKLGDGCVIGPYVVVGAGCQIGANVALYGGVQVMDDVSIGDDSTLYPNVVVRERITIGARVVIHAGSVIGTDGFGYRWDGEKHAKVPQIGTVIIDDDVELGSCVCVDRGKFAATVIGKGAKIDNLVQVAHNVQIGEHCLLAGQAGIAGSAKIGDLVVLGGQSAVKDHVTLGDGVMLAACSAIMEDVPAKAIMSGAPAMPHRQSLREHAAMRRLPELVVQVRELQKQVDALLRLKEDSSCQDTTKA